MNNLFYIFGAGNIPKGDLNLDAAATIIAADGGYKFLTDSGIAPHLVLGDFDSLGYIPDSKNVITAPAEKDDTDMMLAVKTAMSRGADTIVIYGGLGGRFDHSFANIQTLKYIAERGAHAYLVGEGNICTVIKDCGIAFDKEHSGYISVFSLDSQAKGVDLKGLKYPLCDATVSDDFPIGVSNEFTGETASVYVRSGYLLVIWSSDIFVSDKYEIIS